MFVLRNIFKKTGRLHRISISKMTVKRASCWTWATSYLRTSKNNNKVPLNSNHLLRHVWSIGKRFLVLSSVVATKQKRKIERKPVWDHEDRCKRKKGEERSNSPPPFPFSLLDSSSSFSLPSSSSFFQLHSCENRFSSSVLVGFRTAFFHPPLWWMALAVVSRVRLFAGLRTASDSASSGILELFLLLPLAPAQRTAFIHFFLPFLQSSSSRLSLRQRPHHVAVVCTPAEKKE